MDISSHTASGASVSGFFMLSWWSAAVRRAGGSVVGSSWEIAVPLLRILQALVHSSLGACQSQGKPTWEFHFSLCDFPPSSSCQVAPLGMKWCPRPLQRQLSISPAVEHCCPPSPACRFKLLFV